MEISQHNRLIPDVMLRDVIHYALRLVTIRRWDTLAVGALVARTAIGMVRTSQPVGRPRCASEVAASGENGGAPAGTSGQEGPRSGTSSPSSSVFSSAPAAKEAAASCPVGATRVEWKCSVNDVSGGWHEQERCRGALSPLSPGPLRCMVAGWNAVGARRRIDLHRMRAELVAMRPHRSAATPA
jgi:hypothetical protein